MASSGSGYDLSASTFSPDGRIFQVEYATKAVENAGTVIGIKCKDGVVLGCSKPVQHKMIVATTCSYKRIHNVDVHAGIASTGFLPDARVVVMRAVEEAADYQDNYGVKIPPAVLADRLGYYVHYFTLHGALRPFGAACCLAAYDADVKECKLFLVEPNGNAFSYHGVATGKGKQAAKTELEKLNLHRSAATGAAGAAAGGGAGAGDLLSCQQAVQHICKILTMLHQENKDNDGKPLEMELSWICSDSNYRHVAVPKDTVAAARAWAKEQLEEEEEDEEEGGDEGAEGMEEG